MQIDRHHYQPTEAQRAELKRAAAEIRGRGRAMRAMRDTLSGFSRLNVGAQIPAHRSAARAAYDIHGARNAFAAVGWSDSAAAELAEIAERMGAQL